ncbi:MAG: VanZ family protein [Bacteroidetes bacterium]|nr:VanZ family protein [Bacteroidota bacterium]
MFFKKYKFALLWALVILGACGINGNSIPHISFDIGIDKIAHFIFFGLLAWLIYVAEKRYLFLAIFISSIYGISIEYLQMTVFVNRSFDYADMLADVIGALAILPITYLSTGKQLLK